MTACIFYFREIPSSDDNSDDCDDFESIDDKEDHDKSADVESDRCRSKSKSRPNQTARAKSADKKSRKSSNPNGLSRVTQIPCFYCSEVFDTRANRNYHCRLTHPEYRTGLLLLTFLVIFNFL